MSCFKTCLLLLAIWVLSASAQQKRPLNFEDIMKFNDIKSAQLSRDGNWLAWQLQPDRGDPAGMVRSTESGTGYRVERGTKPQFCNSGNLVAFTTEPPLLETENAKKKEKFYNGLSVVFTANGQTWSYQKIKNYSFSEDSRWLVLHFADSTEKKDKKAPLQKGSELLLLHLPDSTAYNFSQVTSFAMDTLSRHLALAVRDSASLANRVDVVDLKKTIAAEKAAAEPFTFYSSLTWDKQGRRLAFVASAYDSAAYPLPGRLECWSSKTKKHSVLLTAKQCGENWTIPFENELYFTRDGERLFFGRLPEQRFFDLFAKTDEPKYKNLADQQTLLEKAQVDVWHWNDGRINSNQKKEWEKNGKRTYPSVYHINQNRFVALTDQSMPFLDRNENKRFALGRSDQPYLKYISWEGEFFDYYRVDLQNGKREKIAGRIFENAVLSPQGKYAVYYHDGNWLLVNLANLKTVNLTSELGIPFANEDHDYPIPAPGYGIAGWTVNDGDVLINDKYDIWQFSTDGKKIRCLTGKTGRENELTFRVPKLDSDKKYFNKNEAVLLEAFHQKLKYTAVYQAQIGSESVRKLKDGNLKYDLLLKAKNADRILFTTESYREFPDLRLTDGDFTFTRKLTDANPQMEQLLWGDAELVEWNNTDGQPLQGVLIKPAGYQPGQRYPVLVYYYRFFSQRLYDFNQPHINHRPCFPLYSSNGYAIFLPDIRFEIGTPGPSATNCLVPGVQKLIDMGIADPDAVALHGHSWSGYQTAFVITETDLFKCAIAGAPVSNMTSAYSGIRWGTGLARQFQYEMTQSRIGGSLVDMPHKYIENSPVFFADRVNTPLLLMFGDVDEAVPWYQGIELYLSLRRHGKDAIFLQYRDEPHHLKKYPNKLDYARKMKEYLDHHLKGEPAAPWISEGVPYRGK